jgi:LuxR family transcriptional regulator, maltose regulon positive regulatory protein
MKLLFLPDKVQAPPSTGRAVHRARLHDVLDAALPHTRLILVSAPAGYGKTTLLAEWVHTSEVPAAWFSLEPDDNDLERFIRYFFHAWQQRQPDIRASELGLLLEGHLPDLQLVLEHLVRLAHESPAPLVFVLDDYHLIENPDIHTALAYLVEHFPPACPLVIASRADPPLPLARLRARDALLELRQDDLRFLTEEASQFFRQRMQLELSQPEMEQLASQMEGWAAGLHLAGLSLRYRPPDRSLQGISGQDRFVADYLSQEILAHLPEDLRQFVLHTSLFERLSGSLCSAVTARPDGQAVLEQLERANLFLVPLDSRREWYRYHHLFAGFLRHELYRTSPDLAPEIHRRAAAWFLEQGWPEPAFQHALAAEDMILVGQIFDRYINARLISGELSGVKRWLDSLPEHWFTEYPILGLGRAGYLAFTGSVEACLPVVDQVEHSLVSASDPPARQHLAKVKAVRCFLACMINDMPRAERFADQALRELPPEDAGFRPVIYSALGDTYRQNGRWDEALECYHKALSFSQAPAMRAAAAHVYGAMADLALGQGRLQLAGSFWTQARAAIEDPQNWGRLPLPVSGWIFIRLAELLFEWDQLDSASEHLERGLERARLGGDLRTQAAGQILLARILTVQGETGQADRALDQARQLLEQAPFQDWLARAERAQLELWLAENRLREAAAWASHKLARDAWRSQPESEWTDLGIVRVQLAQGDRAGLHLAKARLAELLPQAQAAGRAGLVIEILALQALASWQQGDRPAALAALDQALEKAEPEGYIRLFAGLGLSFGRLLQEAAARGLRPAYTARLLQVYEGSSSISSSGAALPAPLTAREQEILELAAAGLTNREIAGQLVISPETVKKHLSSVTAKLGVSSRTQAAARARELGLLS